MMFCSSRDPTPQRNRARQNCISKHAGVLLTFASSATKPQTPAGNRKHINIVEADSGWRPSENNQKMSTWHTFWGREKRTGKAFPNPRLPAESRPDPTHALY